MPTKKMSFVTYTDENGEEVKQFVGRPITDNLSRTFTNSKSFMARSTYCRDGSNGSNDGTYHLNSGMSMYGNGTMYGNMNSNQSTYKQRQMRRNDPNFRSTYAKSQSSNEGGLSSRVIPFDINNPFESIKFVSTKGHEVVIERSDEQSKESIEIEESARREGEEKKNESRKAVKEIAVSDQQLERIKHSLKLSGKLECKRLTNLKTRLILNAVKTSQPKSDMYSSTVQFWVLGGSDNSLDPFYYSLFLLQQ
jgi:hypothetical protein